MGFISNDIVFGTAIERTHCHNGRLLRISIPRDKRLNRHNDIGTDHDRVDRLCRVLALQRPDSQ